MLFLSPFASGWGHWAVLFIELLRSVGPGPKGGREWKRTRRRWWSLMWRRRRSRRSSYTSAPALRPSTRSPIPSATSPLSTPRSIPYPASSDAAPSRTTLSEVPTTLSFLLIPPPFFGPLPKPGMVLHFNPIYCRSDSYLKKNLKPLLFLYTLKFRAFYRLAEEIDGCLFLFVSESYPDVSLALERTLSEAEAYASKVRFRTTFLFFSSWASSF